MTQLHIFSIVTGNGINDECVYMNEATYTTQWYVQITTSIFLTQHI